MLIGSVCMSHSPLLDGVRAPVEAEKGFRQALSRVHEKIAKLKPDLIVMMYPDHVNGFFYRLLPSFCVGIEGVSVGDFGSAPGALSLPVPAAEELAEFIVQEGVDTAISYKMALDHGAIQPLELLSENHEMPPFIPVFVNTAFAPRPTFARVRALGRAVGKCAEAHPERILIIGSGGLSHDPPIPALAGADPQVRAQLINGNDLTFQQRFARTSLVMQEGEKMMKGESKLRPLNPAWDQAMLDAFTTSKLDILDDIPDDELTRTAGRGGHEIRTWFATLAAFDVVGGYEASVEFYEPIEAWLTGMGILTAIPKPAA